METGLQPWRDSASEANLAMIAAKVAYGFSPESLKLPDEVHEALNDIQRVIENLRLAVKGNSGQVIGIASAVPNEGTSTLATMMSLSMAGNSGGNSDSQVEPVVKNREKKSFLEKPSRRPQGVLLIDGQLRSPSLHKIFGLQIEGGLGEFLSGENSLGIFIKNISTSNLKLVTAGQRWKIPLTSFEIEKLKILLDRIKSDFEFVFLDIPPLLHSTEGVTLSKLCDGLILVIRAHHTRWEVVNEAKRLLKQANVNVLGAVLNRRKFYIPESLYRKL